MPSRACHRFALSCLISTVGWMCLSSVVSRAADHGDTPLLKSIAVHDARLTDLFGFVRGDDLVLILGTNPAIPADVTEYLFPPDLRFEVLIDNDSRVRFDDPDDLAEFGGTIVRPKKIREDIVFRVEFDEDGVPILNTKGLSHRARDRVLLFAGLRDDPFIRAPRIGRNVAAVVLQIPLEEVLDEGETLLIWATADVSTLNGRFQELAGRALRSQFPENDQMNTLHPSLHERFMEVRPDVIIYDTSRIAAFPNGRELTDDVVDLVGDLRVLANDAPFPTQNDVPFMPEFPYLAPPQ